MGDRVMDVPELIIAPVTRGSDGVITQFAGPIPVGWWRGLTQGPRLRAADSLLSRGMASLTSKAIIDPARAAERLFREALEELVATVGSDHPMTVYALDRVGLACQLQGEDAEAEDFYLRSLALQQAGRWPHTPWTEVTLLNLAILYGRQGKRDLNETLVNRVKEMHDGQGRPTALQPVSVRTGMMLDQMKRTDPGGDIQL